MAETQMTFDKAAPYERYMGRWSRAVRDIFLAWLAPPKSARWLDVGYGTGAFTELVFDNCSPGAIVAIDPAAAQIEHARRQPIAQRAEFRVADAFALPFPDDGFDIVASALVIKFIPDREKALAEMCRVARSGGTVTGYIWDFTNDLSPNSPLQRALRKVAGGQPTPPGVASLNIVAMLSMFTAAGFADIARRSLTLNRPIAISMTFRMPRRRALHQPPKRSRPAGQRSRAHARCRARRGAAEPRRQRHLFGARQCHSRRGCRRVELIQSPIGRPP